MLQQMRAWFRWLKWLLVVIIFMFVWWAAATWSGGVSGRRPEADWAAQVNGETIRASAFQSYARQLDRTYQSILGDQYAQQRAFIRIGQQALNQLVDEELLYQEAVRQGIGATSQEVAEAITRDPGFQENGRFIGLQRYRQMFRGGRVSLEAYENQVHRRLAIQKCSSLIEDAAWVTDAEVEQEFLRRNQKTTVDYLVVEPNGSGSEPPPDDASIQRYYDEHLDRYMQGEGHTGIYVLVDAQQLAESESITDAEIQAAYDRDRGGRYSVGEQRRASHILFKVAPDAPEDEVARVRKRALSILKRARAGEDFAELARKNSEDSSAANGGDLDFFGRGQMVPEFEDAAFSTPVGNLSDLVKTAFGFHIIKVTDSRPPRTIPIEEVRDQIRVELMTARGRALARERSAAVARASAGGRLEAVAGSQGLTLVETGPVFAGDSLPNLPGSQSVVTRMLTLAPGETSDPIPVAAGQVVVQVTGTVPDAPRPLTAVRDRVVKDLSDERLRARVEASILEVQRKDGGLDTLAGVLKTEMKTAPDMLRGAPLPGVAPNAAIDRQIAALSPGVIGEPITLPTGILILSVRERDDHRTEFESQKDATRESLLRQEQDRLMRAFMRRLRESSEIVVNEPLVQALDQG